MLRVLSLIIFIPIMIMPIIYSNLLLALVYIAFNSIILSELLLIKNNSIYKNTFNIYIIVATFTFFLFIIINIVDQISYIFSLQIIATIWLFDTFSYIGGKIIGGKKLIPSISSGKTISGLISGILFTYIIMQIYQINEGKYFIYSSFTTLIIIVFAFIGDLSVSILKRSSLMKDTGTIMPGHGGLLDRLDSFIGVFFLLALINIFL